VDFDELDVRGRTDGGPGVISQQAIARETGMTAGAVYGYFATATT
jgi:hypothetical protein